MLFGHSISFRTLLSISVFSAFSLLLTGCSHSSESISDFARSVPLQGTAFGGNQPITGATIQLYAAGTGGAGTAATALISATVTTSDGSGLMNSNANAGNANNTLPAGHFRITGDYTCPTPDTQVYITGTGGNPGLTAGTNNTALAIMASLGSCGSLSSSTSISIDEVTTVGSIAALYPYATGYASVASASNTTTALAEEFSISSEYMNSATGLAPGANLPSGYYGSSTEINTLADVLASCINTTGGSAPSGVSDGSACGNLFAAAKPPSGTAPTDTIGAIIDIVQHPTNNVGTIFNQQAAQPPFQPTLVSAPSDWTLPIVPLPQTPYASPAAGTYATAQSVTLTSPTSGATIYYTTNGSTPTTSSSMYTGAISVSASQTINAIAVYRNNTSATGSNTYTITGAPATPVISLAPGTYSTVQTFTVTSATADAAIYVTTDGTTPTSASTPVTGTLQLDQSETLKAIAIAGGVSSGVASATYTFSPTSQVINTLAGGGATSVGDTSAATSATLNLPCRVAVDASGNLYIVDYANHRIRKVTASTGIITTVAGNGTAGFTGDNGPAASAELNNPTGVAVDASGNLYIADLRNNRIRKVTASTGIITTVVGNGTAGYTGDNGAATSAELNLPQSVTLDASGNLYIVDAANNAVRKVTVSTGIITTVAGNGTAGFTGDNGPATGAELNSPSGVAADSSGNLYIADTSNNRVRKLTAATGIIATVAGNGTAGFTGDNGAATSAELHLPQTVAVDASGNLYIADFTNNRIRTVTASTGNISTVAGNGTGGFAGDNGAATGAELSNPFGVAVDASGNLYIADFNNNRIRKVTASTSIITTVAGGVPASSIGDGAVASSAVLNNPYGVTMDASGNVYIADYLNNRIRKVSSTGIITTVAGNGTKGFTGDGGAATSAELSNPTGVAVDASGNLYIADFTNSRIRKVTASSGIISTVAGNGNLGFTGDGVAATSTELNAPIGVALDASGNLYIGDFNNNRVRKVTASTGIITTVAGNGTIGFAGDNGAATSAELNNPKGVAVDASGNVYIADFNNNRIRKVTASTGVITTVAGNGTGGFTGDNGAATSAELNAPTGVAVDTSGNLYIADSNNSRIRKVTASTGNITTVAGTGTGGFTGDNGAATSAEINGATGVAVDASGRLYIADFNNNRIRVVYP